MMRSMYSGISGIRAHQVKMDVVVNNIANVNTTAFKASRVTFQEVLSQTIKPSFSNTGSDLGGTNAQQIGLGVSVGAIDVMNTPSGVQRTDRPFDVSIATDGFFIVSNGTDQLYTRAGNFYLDTTGNLVTESGYKVCDATGVPIEIANSSDYTDFTIDKGGMVKCVEKATGAPQEFGPIGIAEFVNLEGLMKDGGNLYRATANSGVATIGTPGTGGYSELIPNTLEMSNVDLSQEFTDMIIAQRGFQANSRVITTSNNMLEELANIIR